MTNRENGEDYFLGYSVWSFKCRTCGYGEKDIPLSLLQRKVGRHIKQCPKIDILFSGQLVEL